jgi:hypothetical protein
VGGAHLGKKDVDEKLAIQIAATAAQEPLQLPAMISE